MIKEHSPMNESEIPGSHKETVLAPEPFASESPIITDGAMEAARGMTVDFDLSEHQGVLAGSSQPLEAEIPSAAEVQQPQPEPEPAKPARKNPAWFKPEALEESAVVEKEDMYPVEEKDKEKFAQLSAVMKSRHENALKAGDMEAIEAGVKGLLQEQCKERKALTSDEVNAVEKHLQTSVLYHKLQGSSVDKALEHVFDLPGGIVEDYIRNRYLPQYDTAL